MAWDVEGTDQFAEWFHSLDDDQREQLAGTIDLLVEYGPALGRPAVGQVDGSTIHNLKEIRASKGGHLRVLFVFDPRRTAILLVGGDKTGQWKAWYAEAIPVAERLYAEHLAELRAEGDH
ncbi:MAG: type II toxin-antitoxin system RelE/ParE family toxin [Acidimicrobiia bacterium]